MYAFPGLKAAIRRKIRPFRTADDGSSAVEFALIAPIFFALLFAILESAIVFFASSVLETGVQDAGRQLYTHQLQDSGLSLAQQKDKFATDLCNRVKALMKCPIDIDVRIYSAGSAIDIKDPISNGNYDPSGLKFQSPQMGSDSTVVVRAFYQWPIFVSGLGYNIANIGRGSTDSKRLLAATTAFRVEPN